MLCPIKINSDTNELTVHTSCYCVLDLLCVKAPKSMWYLVDDFAWITSKKWSMVNALSRLVSSSNFIQLSNGQYHKPLFFKRVLGLFCHWKNLDWENCFRIVGFLFFSHLHFYGKLPSFLPPSLPPSPFFVSIVSGVPSTFLTSLVMLYREKSETDRQTESLRFEYTDWPWLLP